MTPILGIFSAGIHLSALQATCALRLDFGSSQKISQALSSVFPIVGGVILESTSFRSFSSW